MKRLARVIRGVGCWLFVLVAPLYMLLLAIVLPLVLIPWFGVSRATMLARDARFRRRMVALGRTRTWEDLGHARAAPPGTLIVEERSLGCAYTRVWWTPEDVLAEAERAGVLVLAREDQLRAWSDSNGVPSAFTIWCAQRYIRDAPRQAFHLQDFNHRDRVISRITALGSRDFSPAVVEVVTATIQTTGHGLDERAAACPSGITPPAPRGS